MSQIKQIVKWMGDSGQTVGELNVSQVALYSALVIEEGAAELTDAIYEDNTFSVSALKESSILRQMARDGTLSVDREIMIELADAAADTIVVAVGLLNSLGLDPEAVLAEVIRSNDSKRNSDGTLSMDATGKIIKGLNYTPPNIEQFFKGE